MDACFDQNNMKFARTVVCFCPTPASICKFQNISTGEGTLHNEEKRKLRHRASSGKDNKEAERKERERSG